MAALTTSLFIVLVALRRSIVFRDAPFKTIEFRWVIDGLVRVRGCSLLCSVSGVWLSEFDRSCCVINFNLIRVCKEFFNNSIKSRAFTGNNYICWA